MKILKLPPKSHQNLTITLSTKKTGKAGAFQKEIPIKVENGGRYYL